MKFIYHLLILDAVIASIFSVSAFRIKDSIQTLDRAKYVFTTNSNIPLNWYVWQVAQSQQDVSSATSFSSQFVGVAFRNQFLDSANSNIGGMQLTPMKSMLKPLKIGPKDLHTIQKQGNLMKEGITWKAVVRFYKKSPIEIVTMVKPTDAINVLSGDTQNDYELSTRYNLLDKFGKSVGTLSLVYQ